MSPRIIPRCLHGTQRVPKTVQTKAQRRDAHAQRPGKADKHARQHSQPRRGAQCRQRTARRRSKVPPVHALQPRYGAVEQNGRQRHIAERLRPAPWQQHPRPGEHQRPGKAELIERKGRLLRRHGKVFILCQQRAEDHQHGLHAQQKPAHQHHQSAKGVGRTYGFAIAGRGSKIAGHQQDQPRRELHGRVFARLPRAQSAQRGARGDILHV